jgi:TonB family protein
MPASRLCLALLCLFSSVSLYAQHLLVVRDGDEKLPVVAAKRDLPVVMKGDKPKASLAKDFFFVEGGMWLPFEVSVTETQVMSRWLEVDGAKMNREIELKCKIQSDYPLEDVFIVVLIDCADGSKGIFIHEVGKLSPKDTAPVNIMGRMHSSMEGFSYNFHLFSRGCELPTNLLGLGVADNIITGLIRKKVEGQESAPLKIFLGPMPDYPKAFLKDKIVGKALVRCEVDANGQVSEPSLVEASHPEFGEAAMKVIRRWRFLPKVEQGFPRSSKVQIPFEFSPPVKGS